MIEQTLFAVQTVAKQLNVNARTVIRMIERGELPAFKISGMYRISELDLKAYLENNRTQPKQICVAPTGADTPAGN